MAELYLWSIPTLQYHPSSSAYAMRSAMKPNMLSVRMWQLGGELNASQIISSLVKHKLMVSVLTARRTPVVIMDKKNVGMTDRVNKFWLLCTSTRPHVCCGSGCPPHVLSIVLSIALSIDGACVHHPRQADIALAYPWH